MRLLVRRRSQWAAEPCLSHLSPMQIEALLEYIAHRESERGTLRMYVLMYTALPTIFSLGIGIFQHIWVGLAISVPFFYLLLLVAGEYRYAVYALTQTDDMRVLPTLIQATRHKWGWHPQVRDAILHLLARVTEEHVGLLDDAAQKRLWQAAFEWQTVGENYNHEPALLTLRALAAIGNRATLLRMQRRVHSAMPFHSVPIVVATARELIPAMEARLQWQQAPETLLRAADMPTNAPDMLLRAAHIGTPEPPQQLLRASSGEEREL